MQSVQRPQTHEGRKSWWMFAVWWDHHEPPNDAIAAHHCPIQERASPRGMEGLHRASSGKQANKVWTRFAAGSEASVTCFECHRRCDRISSSIASPMTFETGYTGFRSGSESAANICIKTLMKTANHELYFWGISKIIFLLVQLLKVTSVQNCGKNVKFWILHLSSDIKSMWYSAKWYLKKKIWKKLDFHHVQYNTAYIQTSYTYHNFFISFHCL